MEPELTHGNLRSATHLGERPRLRDLEAIPFEQDGQATVLLRDPLQIGDQAVAVVPDFYWLMLLIDGTRTVDQLQREFSRRIGQPFQIDRLTALLEQLDGLLFLDNERFRDQKSRVVEEYRAQSVRPSSHAGISYPESRDETSRMLSSLYVHPGGAGLAGTPCDRGVEALIAPHIDLRLGGPTYTHAYRYLKESVLPERFVILGIGHMGLPDFFSISPKDFRTPLGIARCDREYVAEVERVLGPETFAEDLTHRNEHSIEFQVLFLQHLLEDRKFSIVPILTSFSYRDVRGNHRFETSFRRLLDALDRAAGSSPKRTCYVASVDLAHLGPRYGHECAPDSAAVEETLERDRALLRTVAAGDSERFLACIEEERNERQVCGFSAIYTLLRLLPDARGRMLAQGHCRMDESGSVVTYASLAFTS